MAWAVAWDECFACSLQNVCDPLTVTVFRAIFLVPWFALINGKSWELPRPRDSTKMVKVALLGANLTVGPVCSGVRRI